MFDFHDAVLDAAGNIINSENGLRDVQSVHVASNMFKRFEQIIKTSGNLSKIPKAIGLLVAGTGIGILKLIDMFFKNFLKFDTQANMFNTLFLLTDQYKAKDEPSKTFKKGFSKIRFGLNSLLGMPVANLFTKARKYAFTAEMLGLEIILEGNKLDSNSTIDNINKHMTKYFQPGSKDKYELKHEYRSKVGDRPKVGDISKEEEKRREKRRDTLKILNDMIWYNCLVETLIHIADCCASIFSAESLRETTFAAFGYNTTYKERSHINSKGGNNKRLTRTSKKGIKNNKTKKGGATAFGGETFVTTPMFAIIAFFLAGYMLYHCEQFCNLFYDRNIILQNEFETNKEKQLISNYSEDQLEEYNKHKDAKDNNARNEYYKIKNDLDAEVKKIESNFSEFLEKNDNFRSAKLDIRKNIAELENEYSDKLAKAEQKMLDERKKKRSGLLERYNERTSNESAENYFDYT